ncbi:hypothetical protein GCM10007989_11970 [Devosia pacifica]|uniref:histidine kinase n=1 Tax=Devosia pacifica TaxID=1335967 RepID=A0A918S0T4_9HYPH|nr:ATP-binding protein [Devosia pacifica]GHA18288.1 hypothetical protein GCM10007989_11970 [Devosia pacifica]
MAKVLAKLGRKASPRLGLAIVLLTLISVILLSSTVWMFAGLRDRQQSVERSIREDAVWAAFQTDREAARLVEATLIAQTGGDIDALILRYDLLYSRVTLLGDGSYAVPFGAQSELGERAEAVSDIVQDLEPTIDALLDEPARRDALLTEILASAEQVIEASNALIVSANAETNALRVEERRKDLDAYWRIGIATLALTLTLVMLIVLLGVQIAHISRSGRAIELLGRRNAKKALEAREAMRAKSAFLATMSHEIRTPLNGILGMTSLLQQSRLSPEQARHVVSIRQSGDVLLDVITDILDYSKLEAGAASLAIASFELAEVMRSVETIMRPRAEVAGLKFDMEWPDWEVTSDPARVRQVLLNLVGNAVKFTAEGSVRVMAEVDEAELKISVTDTGKGIAAADMPLLFKDFSQIDSSSTRSFGGTGLGLAISKRLVEALNGTINVESRPGQGSTFWFSLPVAPARPLAEAERAVSHCMAPVEPSRFVGTVLVVDDNAINREVSAGLLEAMGLDVVTASNGREAVDLAGTLAFSMIFMDMQMPEMDGLAATRALRQQGIDVPIAGLTANAFASDRDACLAAGMNDYVSKPATPEKLAQVLRRQGVATADEEAVEAGAPSDDEAGAAEWTVDTAYQEVLREQLGEETFAGLLVQFEADVERLAEEAISAWREDELAAYDAALHTLKGAALALGYGGVAETANALRKQTANPVAALEAVRGTVRERLCA